MVIEIISTCITNGVVEITAADVSEEHLQYMERTRMDEIREVKYLFDTHDAAAFKFLRWFLKNQKSCRSAATYGEALARIQGTIVNSPSNKYRVWD